jgi:spermidine/putrescine transport system substrate-binding protein
MVSFRNRIRGVSAAALLALATAGADAQAAQQELNALVWCDHTDPALLEPFERHFDV